MFVKSGNESKIWGKDFGLFKDFVNRGNGSKIRGTGPKIWGNRLTNWDF